MILGIFAMMIYANRSRLLNHDLVHNRSPVSDICGGIKTALDDYKIDTGYFPKSLNDLIRQSSDAKNWRGPYLDPPQVPVDPWGDKYIYEFPGKHNPDSYDLMSAGPDGKRGTDDDIGNWTTQ
jgi:type II secretion system protein G